jgi:hypothetical protein
MRGNDAEDDGYLPALSEFYDFQDGAGALVDAAAYETQKVGRCRLTPG